MDQSLPNGQYGSTLIVADQNFSKIFQVIKKNLCRIFERLKPYFILIWVCYLSFWLKTDQCLLNGQYSSNQIVRYSDFLNLLRNVCNSFKK